MSPYTQGLGPFPRSGPAPCAVPGVWPASSQACGQINAVTDSKKDQGRLHPGSHSGAGDGGKSWRVTCRGGCGFGGHSSMPREATDTGMKEGSFCKGSIPASTTRGEKVKEAFSFSIRRKVSRGHSNIDDDGRDRGEQRTGRNTRGTQRVSKPPGASLNLRARGHLMAFPPPSAEEASRVRGRGGRAGCDFTGTWTPSHRARAAL